MVAETSQGNSIVPVTGVSVKKLISETLAGESVRVRPFALDVASGTSLSALVGICEKMFRFSSKVSVTVQFYLGDAYNYTPPYSAMRRDLLAGVTRAMGGNYADRLRGFGRVARNWPEDRRSDKYPWQHFKDHKPGVPGKPDVKVEKNPGMLTLISSEAVDGFVVHRVETPGGVPWTLAVPVKE